MNRKRKYIEEQKFLVQALLKGDHNMVVFHLGRIHILAQNSVSKHMATHFQMFLYALVTFNFKEVLGQLIRLIVTIPGHVIGKVPKGNIGWSTVGLTEVMPIPNDLKSIIEPDGKT